MLPDHCDFCTREGSIIVIVENEVLALTGRAVCPQESLEQFDKDLLMLSKCYQSLPSVGLVPLRVPTKIVIGEKLGQAMDLNHGRKGIVFSLIHVVVIILVIVIVNRVEGNVSCLVYSGVQCHSLGIALLGVFVLDLIFVVLRECSRCSLSFDLSLQKAGFFRLSLRGASLRTSQLVTISCRSIHSSGNGSGSGRSDSNSKTRTRCSC